MVKTIFTKNPVKFIPALAEALKNIEAFEIPEWAIYVKSGTSRERPPVDDDFWYIRTASILRQLYIKGVFGVGKLRTKYGSRKDRGGRPDKFKKSGGKIIRVILQQAEAAGLVEKVLRLQHGRRLTQAGRDLLDSIEVENPSNLDFDNLKISNKPDIEPVEILQEDSEKEGTIEEAVEISEDKGEKVMEKSEDEIEGDKK